MDGWNTFSFPFGIAYFQGRTVSFRVDFFWVPWKQANQLKINSPTELLGSVCDRWPFSKCRTLFGLTGFNRWGTPPVQNFLMIWVKLNVCFHPALQFWNLWPFWSSRSLYSTPLWGIFNHPMSFRKPTVCDADFRSHAAQRLRPVRWVPPHLVYYRMENSN